MVDHPLLLQGLGFPSANDVPLILARTDEDFLANILEQVKSESGVPALLQTKAVATSGTVKLFQPVQRTFNVVICEAVCDVPGKPRLDPAKIESAGLVVRRSRPEGGLEGWMEKSENGKGWRPLSSNEDQLKRDPDAARRSGVLRVQPAVIATQIRALRTASEERTETVHPLFVAPAEVCAAVKKTILYGVVPVTSDEISEAPPLSLAAVDLSSAIPTFLKAGLPPSLPRPATTINLSVVEALDKLDPSFGEGKTWAAFVVFLRQIVIEFDALGTGQSSQSLGKELQTIILPLDNVGRTQTLSDFLAIASRVVLEGDPAAYFAMPVRWPQIDPVQAARIAVLLRASMETTLNALAPGERRFENLRRTFELRAFVRVTRSDGCPPEIAWSKPSAPFTIAQWYEAGGAPPARVELPDVFDRNLLKGLKPNVAFILPPGLQELMGGINLKDLMDKKKPGGGGLAIGWICSFNIPTITFCAFIVLNIFLSLLNLIFQWLLFIKICIPYPRREP